MIACDVNVLVSAHHTSDTRHDGFRRWLEDAMSGPVPVALPSIALSGFVRVVTHPKVLLKPLSPDRALAVAAGLRRAPAAVELEPGPRHWALFDDLCRRVEARGNVVPDAYLAAPAVEHGCEWITADRGFARFPGLRWRHPLD
ncbi:MAG: type II toxin-antitoxin system VapC family toxin [Kineosporiaceae bacterium]